MNHLNESENSKASAERQLRKNLKQAGDFELPMDEDFYEKLHNKIMAAVEETEITPLSKLTSTQQLMKRYWRKALPYAKGVTQVIMALALLLGSSIKARELVQNFWSSSHTVQMVQNEKQIINEALESPEQFSTSLISYQNQNDFFLDVAAQSEDSISALNMKDLTTEEAN